jgi:Response regulator containing CheY-like receiver domain and AraC-type DNA-binding domain
MEKRTILCVDDEPILLLSLKVELKTHYGESFSYEIATSADEGLKVVDALRERGVKIIAILSDWLMPGLRGDDFARLVHERYPDIAIVLITGYADNETVKKAMGEGIIRECIRKPWSGQEIFEAIDRIVDESRDRA